MPNALVLSPESPYPTYGGGPIRTASLIEYLRRKYTVDLIVFREESPLAIPIEKFGAVLEVRLPYHSKRVPAKLTRNISRLLRGTSPLIDRFTGFDQQIGDWLSGKHYDVAIAEHMWTAPYANLLRRHAAKIVCDLHNVESQLLTGIAPVFAPATRKLEGELLPKFDAVLVASEADAQRLNIRSVVYPNAVPPRESPPRSEHFAIAMSGNFEFPPNAQGRQWFEKNVWPLLTKEFPGLEWRLIGKGARPVDDAVAELAKAQLAIVPIFSGSGTRLKILEAWAAGTPVVSTTLGAEGLHATHGKDILLADTADAFYKSIENLMKNPDMRQSLMRNARVLLNERFIWPAAWERLERSGTL